METTYRLVDFGRSPKTLGSRLRHTNLHCYARNTLWREKDTRGVEQASGSNKGNRRDG